MPIRTILTVTGPNQGDRDLKLAAGLAEEVGAHLSILAVTLAAPPAIGAYAVVVSDAWLDERRADTEHLERRSKEVAQLLAGTSISGDVTSAYPEYAWSDETIGRRARYADLTVVGPELMTAGALREKVIEGVLFSSGKPLLLVPENARPTLKPKRVMVAWDARVEASRAVREALDILAAAEEVRVVLVDPVESELDHGAEPGANIAAYLSRHGAKIVVDRLPSMGRSVADVLRGHAVDNAAELIVMGAYGHSRLRERIFGGVTRSILEQPPVPVLLAR